MWPVFFLCWTVLLGSFLSRVFPKWLPYTVGLLLVGFALGTIAQSLELAVDCPMYAQLHDRNRDGLVSRSEWDRFVCAGCDAHSVCAAWDTEVFPTLLAQNTPVEGLGDFIARGPDSQKPYSCGPDQCGYTFEELDRPWKITDMLAESVKATYRSAHRRLGSAAPDGTERRLSSSSSSSGSGGSTGASSSGSTSAGTGVGDGYLTGDELWTPRCNLLRDMLSLMDIDPHLMLVVFLPALLFESACFGIDLGIFRRQLLQILMMAFPAMALASFITAILLWALAPSTWTLWVCWLIGIISSATDPVAVVALLKELGAAKTLGTLIEGESLLNDGSAVVLFVWVRNVIGYDYATAPPGWMESVDGERYTGQIGFEFMRIVTQMALFAFVLGPLTGWVAVKLAIGQFNNRPVEVSIIVTLSYLVFWLGELVCGSSAVLAVVTMGLYVNANKSCISPPVLHFLHEFYEMIAYFLNTIIFVIAGAKLGALAVDTSFHHLWAWGSGSLSMIMAIYPIVLFARGAAILIFFPLLKRVGTGCTWKEAVVMWWGGLRGSVGLALALSVHHLIYDRTMWGDGASPKWGGLLWDPTLDCRDQPMMVLILTLMVVMTTVVINGITMAPLMRLLKLTDVPQSRQLMLQRARVKIAKKTAEAIAQVKELHGDELLGVDWEKVTGCTLTHAENATDEITDRDKATWLLVLNMERAYYLHAFEKGELQSEAFHVLEDTAADICAEADGAPAKSLGAVYDRHFEKLLGKLHKMRASHAYEAALTYLGAQHEVEHLTWSPKDESRRDESLRTVRIEHQDNILKMQTVMSDLREKAPNATRHFSAQYVGTVIRLRQRAMVEELKHEGELVDLDTAPIVAEIDEQVGALLAGGRRRRALLRLKDTRTAKVRDGAVMVSEHTARDLEHVSSRVRTFSEAPGGAEGAPEARYAP